MRINVARQPAGLVAATFIVMLALSVVRSLLSPYPAETMVSGGMPLPAFIDSLFPGAGARYSITVVFLFLNAMLLTRIMIIYKACFGRSYLPFVMYAAAATGIFFPIGTLAAPLAALLLTASSEQAVAAFRRRYRFSSVFNSAFMLGFVPLLYAPAVCLLPILAVTLAIYQRGAREVVVSIVGLFLPWALCSIAWWIAGYGWGHVSAGFISAFTQATSGYELRLSLGGDAIPMLVFSTLYIAVIAMSVVLMIRNFSSYPNRIRKVYIHFTILFLLTGTMFLLPSSDPATSVALMAVPATVVGTHFFARMRSVFALSVYILLLLAFIAANLGFLF